MFSKIRKSKATKIFVVFISITLIHNLLAPTVAFALTSGPSSPEIQSFEPMGTNQMVDLFSGDFTYNIPLFELPGPNGGYPFNLAYHSGVTMEQEASWVGLGWTLNPGAINRTVRGVPDDFNGGDDKITHTMDMKRQVTFGIQYALDGEIFGAEVKKAGLGLNASVKLYYNNYRGLGLGYGVGLSPTYLKSKYTLGLGLDSQNGANVSLSASITNKTSSVQSAYGLGVGLNSKAGLSLSLNLSRTEKLSGNKVMNGYSMEGSSSISFAKQAFNPSINYETKGHDFNLAIEWGAGIQGFNGDQTIAGFYMDQTIKDKNFDVEAYGYMNLQTPFDNNTNRSARMVLDYNREKENMLTKQSPNLAIPSLTYDYYAIQGQGIGGMFRPFRSDYGHVHPMPSTSKSIGVALGADLGIPGHGGGNGTFSQTVSTINDWVGGNGLTDYKFSATESSNSSDYEPYYMRVLGEHTPLRGDEYTNEYSVIGYDDPIEIQVGDETLGATQLLPGSGGKNRYEILPSTDKANSINSLRPVRSTAILTLKNEDLDGFSANGGIYDGGSFDRGQYSNHIGAYSIVNADGRRYVYALPVYNNTKKEFLFSVNGPTSHDDIASEVERSILWTTNNEIDYNVSNTDKFYSCSETSEYAYSYLLTAVLGADYVDITGDGPTDEDLGYWVKFNYTKHDDDFGWRAPFQNARYIAGVMSTAEDDKASFMYGEREMYYLNSVETKTHVAEFFTRDRVDAKGSTIEGNVGAGTSQQLDKITISVKPMSGTNVSGNTPIKTIHFKYNNSLCPGTPNSFGGNVDGKLTLKAIYSTTPQSSNKLSPYFFEYDENAAYDQLAVDRWGNYSDKFDGVTDPEEIKRAKEEKLFLPYDEQFDKDEWESVSTLADLATKKHVFKEAKDREASMWNLSKIHLPSGGVIEVDYEADDYAYVQHRQATQMFKIDGIGEVGNSSVFNKSEWKLSGDNQSQNSELKIYFTLEEPVKNVQQLYQKYIAGLKRPRELDATSGMVSDYYPLYFKIKSVLSTGGYKDYVSGYAEIDIDAPQAYGLCNGTGGEDDYYISDASGEIYYTKAFVKVKPQVYNTKWGRQNFHHPFASAAWEYIRNNRPQIMSTAETNWVTDLDDPGEPAESDVLDKVMGIFNILDGIDELARDFSTRAFRGDYGNAIVLDKSVIKLCTPDKEKYGGGCRVRSITMSDSWDQMSSEQTEPTSYGQIYDYTMIEDNQTISSGVASYEPMIGGDENALKFAKKYPMQVPMNSSAVKFFEYPVNESYFPGASVGYRQVKVWSIDSYNMKDQNAQDYYNDGNIQLTGTGYSEHQFYTYKEFPVMVHETAISRKSYDWWFPYPFVGQESESRLTAGQGYSIVLNDMNGKPKSVHYYSQPTLNSQGKHISGVDYEYQTENVTYDGQQVLTLDNEVSVLYEDIKAYDRTNPPRNQRSQTSTLTSRVEQKIVGVDTEVFTDFTESKTDYKMGGLSINLELVFTPLPVVIPVPWPSLGFSNTKLNTAVTNKVVHKSGILKSVTNTDGTSVVKVENQIYDDVTGRPLLTKTYNTFDNPIYNYSVPAYKIHDRMGPAYANLGMECYVDALATTGTETLDLSPADFAKLEIGDELIVTIGDEELFATVEPYGNSKIIKFSQGHSGEIHGKVVRSGRRNLLNADGRTIQSFNSPLSKSLTTTFYDESYEVCGPPTPGDISPSLIYECANFIKDELHLDQLNNTSYYCSVDNNYKVTNQQYSLYYLERIKQYYDYEYQSGIYMNQYLATYNVFCDKIWDASDLCDNMPIAYLYTSDAFGNGSAGDIFTNYDNDPANPVLSNLRYTYPVLQNSIISPETGNSFDGFEYTIPYSEYSSLLDDDYPQLSRILSSIKIVQTIVKGPQLLNACITQDHTGNDVESYDPRNVISRQGSLLISAMYHNPEIDVYFMYIDPEDGVEKPLFYPTLSIPINYFDGYLDESSIFFGQDPLRLDLEVRKKSSSIVLREYTEWDEETWEDVYCARFDALDANGNVVAEGQVVKEPIIQGPSTPNCQWITQHRYEYLIHQQNVLQASNTYYSEYPAGENSSASFDDGSRGIWRPWITHYYNDKRYSSIDYVNDNNAQISTDGLFANGTTNNKKFYYMPYKVTDEWLQPGYWKTQSQVTRYDEQGNVLEQRDALGIYSSARYKYNNTLPVVVAHNARHDEIFFESFDAMGNTVSSTSTHRILEKQWYGTNQRYFSSNHEDIINTDIVLEQGTKYFIGIYGIRYGYTDYPNAEPSDFSGMLIQSNGQNIVLDLQTQMFDENEFYRATGSFTPSCQTVLRLSITNLPHTEVNSLIVIPYYAKAKAYSYDEQMRLQVEYDENFYPTFYSYDETGQVSQIRKLTNDGIKTLKEGRKHFSAITGTKIEAFLDPNN